ncbi:AMP-binding protein [Streptomyces malaysiensis]|uniref:AMP-binding protein n=1 Tax=Streptomyces malaysiensis TaxID=92644 RepID=UPI002B28DB65|nr:AMP-binding protein [Streptomyces malaysiensis]
MTTNLVRLLLDRAEARPGLAIGTLDDQIRLADALEVAAGGAERLRSEGLGAGDRVALVAGTSTDYLIVWLSCFLAGVPVALINPTYPEQLLGQMLDRFDPAIVHTDLADTSFARGRAVRPVRESRGWPVADPFAAPGRDTDRHAIASFMHTSGTTGVPKFCAQSHEYFVRLGGAVAGALGLTAEDRLLAPLPLFHINPLGYGVLGALSAGADALAVRRFSASAFWGQVRRHAITALTLHAPPVEILKRATTAEDAAGHRIRTMFYADGEFLRRFGIPFAVSGYGSTEAAGVTHLRPWSAGDMLPPNASHHGGAGRPDVDWRLTGAGEIQVRETEPGALFSGYFTADGLDPARDADGWFATGDLGELDEHGGLVFLERAAESIRVKGEFVPIPYVENWLGTIDALTDLALWKRTGELVDDEVVLYVVADHVPVECLTAAVGELPAFMRPRFVARVDRIPRDAAAGKVQRRLLPEQEVRQWLAIG